MTDRPATRGGASATPGPAARLLRTNSPAWRAGAIVVALLVGLETLWLGFVIVPASDVWFLGMDYAFYRDLGARFLTEGTYYWAHQLQGPYEGTLMVDVFYPPHALVLFMAAAMLPAVIWWIVPVVVLVYVCWRLQPPAWAWILMLALVAWPRAIGAYLFGNTDIWMVAAVAGGIRWGWPAALLFLKPTIVLFVLPAVRHRGFWLGTTLVALATIAVLPLTADYVTAMRNLTIRADYPLGSLPLMLVPIVAWVTSASFRTSRAKRADAPPADAQ